MKKEFLTDAEPTASPEQTQVNRCGKFYLRAKRFGPRQVQDNKSTEGLYHQILDSVKKLYAQLPNQADRAVFEMNRKSDKTSVTGIHDFLAPTFLWSLECDVWGKYWIQYSFNNSPFEQVIRQKFDNCALTNYLKGKEIKDFDEYYRAVLRCQPKDFITILESEVSNSNVIPVPSADRGLRDFIEKIS